MSIDTYKDTKYKVIDTNRFSITQETEYKINQDQIKIENLELENLNLKCELSYYKKYSEFLEEKLKKIGEQK